MEVIVESTHPLGDDPVEPANLRDRRPAHSLTIVRESSPSSDLDGSSAREELSDSRNDQGAVELDVGPRQLYLHLQQPYHRNPSVIPLRALPGNAVGNLG